MNSNGTPRAQRAHTPMNDDFDTPLWIPRYMIAAKLRRARWWALRRTGRADARGSEPPDTQPVELMLDGELPTAAGRPRA